MDREQVRRARIDRERAMRMAAVLNKLEYDEYGIPECWPSEAEVADALGYPGEAGMELWRHER